MQIRPYAEPDEAAVLALWEDAGIARPWLDLRAEIPEKLRRDPQLFLVAVENVGPGAPTAGARGDERIVGAVMGAYDGRRGWLYHLAVAPDRQRLGIGSALVRAAERAMAEIGVAKVNLQVRAENAAVIGFYAKLGYRDEDLKCMGKRLR